jgi:hypothetical protein
MLNMFHYMYVLVIELRYIFIKMHLVLRKSFIEKQRLRITNILFLIRIHDRDQRYYADGEDAFSMRRELASPTKVCLAKKEYENIVHFLCCYRHNNRSVNQSLWNCHYYCDTSWLNIRICLLI